MISVPIICRRRISPTEGGYHTEGISPVLQGTDIIEKRLLCLETKESFFFGAVEGTSFFVPVVACVPRWRTPCTLKAGVLKMRHWRIFWLRHHTLQVPFGAVEGTSFFVPVVACVPRWRTPCTLKAGVLKMRHWRIFWLRHHTLQVPLYTKGKLSIN
jgi:hypothetical protein